MSLPEFSVRRPVTVLMTTVAVALFGFLSASQLPVELLPDLSYPTLTIQTGYPDAAPISVEQFVTRPLEESVGVIPGVREMRSVSRAGLSEVILEFEWDEPMDFAAMEVREKMGLAVLPREAGRPRVLRFDPSLDPILRLAFDGDRPLDDLRRIAERWLKPRLEAVQGVAAAKVRGGLDPEIEVEADEDRLAALGLTLDDMAQALRAENVNRPGGTVRDWGSVYLVRTLNEFEDLEQIRRTVIREGATGRVRVEDVADVRRGHRDREEITRSGGEETVEIALHREGSANTIHVAEAIRAELKLLRKEMAEDLSLTLLTDQSTYIAEAVGQVRWAALLGGMVAIAVLFFFLRDPGSTLIVAATIPLSVIAAFLPMYRAGVSLNIMSLGGLALGVGMLVDNSIVVLESIDRQRRRGRSRRDAARVGGQEVAGAVTAATLTTLSVFLPIVFVKGVAGQLFYDLAVTVCLALLASLIVSLTLIPMLSAVDFGSLRRIDAEIALRAALGRTHVERLPFTWRIGPLSFAPVGGGRSWVSKAISVLVFPLRLAWRLLTLLVYLVLAIARLLLRWFTIAVVFTWHVFSWGFRDLTRPLAWVLDGLGRAYPGVLTRALGVRWLILPPAFGLFVVSLAAVPLLGTTLVPDLSQGEFAFQLRLSEGTTLEATSEIVGRVENRLDEDPDFSRIFSVVGSLPSTASGRQTLGENLAQINFVLRQGAGADLEAQAIDRVRRALALFPMVEAELAHPSVLTVRPPIAVNVFSDDLAALGDASDAVARTLAEIPGVEDLATTWEPGNPEVTIELDRERAASLGVEAEALGRSLRRQVRGEVVGEFREQEERVDIRLRAAERARDRATDVGALRFRLDNGAVIPVSAVAQVEVGRGPAAIHRAHGARVAQITAKVTSRDLGRALEDVRRRVATLVLPGVAVAELTGQELELERSFDSLRLALALAVFMVYVVMAVQFESLRYPLVILLSVPLGVVGVVAALLITGTGVTVLSLIGVVMLAGIVVNNAIVLVDAINRRRRQGEALQQAIVGAGQERLRPILMTTATTVLALLPMALGLGAGDELRRPLAITVIGGLTGATLLTLVVIPCLYFVFTPRRAARATEGRATGESPRSSGGSVAETAR